MCSPLVFAKNLLLLLLLPLALEIRRASCVSAPPPSPSQVNCPSSCSTLHNVSFPFGTNNNCGLPEFRLNCSSSPPLWWPPDSSSPLYKVLDITFNDKSSGTVLVQNISKVSACAALTNPGKSYPITCPEKNPFGLEFGVADTNINLVFGCSNTSKLNVNSALPNSSFIFSSPDCVKFYSSCDVNVSNQKHVPCFEGMGEQANVSSIKETYRCKGNSSFLSLPTSQSSELAVQLYWIVSQSYYDCSSCKGSNGICNHQVDDESFVCSCPDGRNSTTSCHAEGCKLDICRSSVQFSLGASAIAIAILIVGASFGIYCCCKSKTVKKLKSFPLESSMDLKLFLADQCGPIPQKTFTYDELLYATNSFSVNKMLGDGGFGTVYEGTLYNGQKVAVKRLYAENTRRLEQFLNEIRIVSALVDHPNLVKLYGFCCEKHEDLLLVYEFVSNGTLAYHLHGDAGKGLLWETRLNIALETAQALAYLHCCDPPILHRDVKSTNILLDKNFHVKVADFGLSRFLPVTATHISTAPQGTPGYVDPEYHHCYQLNDKSDVYSFGVVLVELVSGKTPVDLSRDHMEINLSSLAVAKIQTGALDELIDPYLEVWHYSADKEMVQRVAELAFQCLALSKDDRPSMKLVVKALNDIKTFGYGDGGRKKKLQPLASRDSFDMADETSKLMETCKMATSPTSMEEKWPSSASNSVASSAGNSGKRQIVLES